MTPFGFQTTCSVLSEVGASAKIGGIMAGMGCRKVAFVTDPMIVKLGLGQAALDGRQFMPAQRIRQIARQHQ